MSFVDFSHDHFTKTHFIFVKPRGGDGDGEQGGVSATGDSFEEFSLTTAERACSVCFIRCDEVQMICIKASSLVLLVLRQ